VPVAVTEEQLSLQASIRDWAKRAEPLALVRGLEPGHGPLPAQASQQCWGDLAGLGVFSIAVPSVAGGADGTVADLAAAVEQLTLSLVPGPVMPTLLAGLVLTRLAGDSTVPPPPAAEPTVPALLAALAAGELPAAVALATGSLTGDWQAGGSLRVSGEAGPVLGGGPRTQLLAGAMVDGSEVWFCAPVRQSGISVTERSPVDFSRPLATIRFAGADIDPGQILAGVSLAQVRDLAATLYAVEASAVASWCSRAAAEHARTRRQFGRPIGTFQAVKHLCAGMLCRAERATVLAWDAARSADEAPADHPLAAAAAAAIALDAAVDNAKDCIQVLGGTGFTWEHDAHLYLRRALALRQLLGGSAAWQTRTAVLALAGARRRVALAASGAGTRPVAKAARAVALAVGAVHQPGRRAALAEAGYVAPQWPPPWGLGASTGDVLVIDEELARAGLSRPDLVIGGWAGLAVVQHGTPAQQQRFAGPTLRGEITWCQLFSEPEAGSDLASLRTRAERVNQDGEAAAGWRLTGQKVWTSLAHEAGWAICLARTDPGAAKHRGLTFFLVDMHSDGIEIRPLREITGREMFNEVFLDEVFVPDSCVLGAPGDGWRIARSTLVTERVTMGRGSVLGDEVESLIAVIKSAGLDGDPAVLQEAGALIADGLAGSLLDLRSALAQLSGTDAGHLAAVRKLQGVAHRQAVAEAALVLCGPGGAAADGAAADRVHEFLLTRCLSIAGGTTQILLSVVAERVLGLPREEMR
jgi:alkylation response protein AidB-like acyl-CoA dehydrogenase